MELEGAAALVTGGAGGLGEATVRRLVAAGARVVIADLARDKGEALAGELGPAAAFSETDVTSEESVAGALEQAAALGPVRVAVAVHGGFGGGGRTLKSDGTPHQLDDFRRTVEHYLVGTFNVVRLAAAAIGRSDPRADGERGVIVNTASIAGYEGTVGTVAYASAKGGVIGMTIAAARDLAVVGIRVVTIAPGTFLTPAYGADPDAVEAMWAPAIPFPKRMGRPDEYAQLVQSVCENPYLNGEVIRIDGALRFGPRGPR
ncbi:MAG TPA: SDR family NAD(P)-dependent oxidoreductase [Acidimicrobiales bacterium]|jgi:NAD(P)-dependent dehydrogenase (short-subunit alcohol dehydrogenase family)|nr:SDR family NAD(P)-dependent oxidoreductase [Acidimicrobiales bacterium]